MSVAQRGFSLLEMLIAMAVSSVLLLSSARFLPALQRVALLEARQQRLEEEVWQRAFTLSRHLQRAGYCRNSSCRGEPLRLSSQCALIRWDGNIAGGRETSPQTDADVTGFRLREGALETLRGATSCEGKGWEKMTDPDRIQVETFRVVRHNHPGFAPTLAVTLSASLREARGVEARAHFSVEAYNL